MNKSLPILFLLLFFVQISNAQFLWYENESNTAHLEYLAVSNGIFSTDVSNPNNTGINTNSIVSRFERNESTSANISFQLKSPITDIANLTIGLKAHISLATEDLKNPNTRIRIYLGNSTISSDIYIQKHFSVGQTWQAFEFNFSELEIPNDVINAGGFDILRISFIHANNPAAAATYHLDSIYGSVDQTGHIAAWLSGSWGVTFPIYGGERLDSEVAGGYNYIAGAQQIIDELPATGHIITNLSNFAKSYYFTLRGNENVDIATEIDESFVPSLENEKIIFDVLQMYRNAGKKNILYISTNYFDRLNEDTHALWVTYYTNKFAGNEYLAYRDLVQGFILRTKEYADAYWLDTTSELYDDGHLEDFVQMIRDAHPGCAVSVTGVGAAYFEKDGEYILVDSDGLDDEEERDYKIIKFEAVNTYQDFTRGHVTPLGQGAPPNSWAYEEFTIPAMVENPWSTFKGNTVLKHAWFPMRDKWHVSSANLIFGTEDAYRFARNLVDAKAGVTFATTINDKGSEKGFMSTDEMLIMKEINNRLLSIPMPDYEPYVRPEGAYLVGEASLSVNLYDKQDVKFYPNPIANRLIITRIATDVNYITVVNVMGAEVIKKVWGYGATKTQLDMSSVSPGLYFVHLSDGNNYSITRKIIVSK